MAISAAPRALKRRINRFLTWQHVRRNARRRGIEPDDLSRVRNYLDAKFGVRQFETANPTQRVSGYFPGLSLVPVYDAVDLEWVKSFEDNAALVRDEFLALKAAGAFEPHPQKLADQGSWSTYYFYSNGYRFDDHCEACPVTASVLDQVPGAGSAGQAYFSVMSGGTHVKAHSGPTNTRIRCHLGLVVPESCEIRVDDQYLKWKELGCIVFDDSVDHEVWISDEERAVLIVDLWHPELTDTEKWALGEIAKLSGRNKNYRNMIGT